MTTTDTHPRTSPVPTVEIRSAADGELTSIDLRRYAEKHPGGETSRWRLGCSAEAIEVLHYPAEGLAGVAWGADPVWTECDDAKDAVYRVCITGEVRL